MKTKQKLTLKQVAIILCLSPISISRLAKLDESFPNLERVGRSVFVDDNQLYKWLSLKAGQPVTANDTLMRSGDIESYYSKSGTWVWMQVKAGNLPKPFKINRTNFWLLREILGKSEAV